MPLSRNYVSRADSAEPKTISYLQRHGLPRMEGVKKWPNSILEGIRFIRGYKSVIIHPDCPNTARDFRLYSHKIDKNTQDIFADVEDGKSFIPIVTFASPVNVLKSGTNLLIAKNISG